MKGLLFLHGAHPAIDVRRTAVLEVLSPTTFLDASSCLSSLMDTKAYLMNQGWSGPGSPLNPTHRPRESGGQPHRGLGWGLSKPILVSRKDNTFGIGKKGAHDHANQWWLRGFEEALKGVGTDGSSTPTSTSAGESATPGDEKAGSELYRYFVKGQVLPSTIRRNSGRENENTHTGIKQEGGEKRKKRKRNGGDGSTKKQKREKTKAADGAESIETSTGDGMTPEETGTKLRKKKAKVTNKNGQSLDSAGGEGINNKEHEITGKERTKKKKREKVRKGKEAEKSKLPAEDSAEELGGGINRTSAAPAIVDNDERKQLKAIRKQAKKERKEEKMDRNSKSKRTKSKDDG